MATSGSTSVTVTKYDTLKFSWEVTSQSIENNTSTVSWKLQLIATAYGRFDSSANKDYTIVVNGTTYTGENKIGIGNNETKTLKSGTTTIQHNTDGTKTFSYSFKQEINITFSGTKIGTKSGSGTGTLNTIPRKSSLSASNGTLGTAQTLTVTKQASAFTHTITYKCGSATGTVCTKSSDTSISFTPPLSLASQNTTGTSVSVVFTITTYNGSTNVGTNSKTITCSIPSSVKPSCTVAVSDPMGYVTTYGGYVKGLSKFKVVVTPTIAHGSAIASYKTTANGATYTAASFTTGVLKSSGTLSVSATVTDKRGRTSSAATKSLTVLDYSAPNISKLTVKRCDADGTENGQGGYVQVTFSGSVTSLNSKNSVTYTLKYKAASASSYTTASASSMPTAYSVSNHTYIFAADTGSSYDVQLTVKDDFSTITKTTTASTGYTIMHFKANGKGMAVGKVSETDDVLDVGMTIRARKDIINDNQWIPLTLNSEFKVYEDNANNQPRYKAFGSVVTIMGAISPVTEFTSSTTTKTFATGLPSALRPKMALSFVCQGSGMNRWTLMIGTSGDIRISRYGTTAHATVPTTAWLQFCCTYQV